MTPLQNMLASMVIACLGALFVMAFLGAVL